MDLATLFPGDSEMAQRMRTLDWAATPLGSPDGWPQSLKTVVGLCLASRCPIVLWWGPQLVALYNDAYRPVLGDTLHPRALGAPGAEVWPEMGPETGTALRELVTSALHDGNATPEWAQQRFLDRSPGGVEECHFVYGHSPIRDESGGVGGVYSNLSEVSDRVIGHRRWALLRDLGAISAAAGSVGDACAKVSAVLDDHRLDLPFAGLYVVDKSGTNGRLTAATGDLPPAARPAVIALDDPAAAWPIGRAVAERAVVEVERLQERFGTIASGPWPDPVQRALVLPMFNPGQAGVVALLIAGTSTRRDLDAAYRGFFGLVAREIAAVLNGAQAGQPERTGTVRANGDPGVRSASRHEGEVRLALALQAGRFGSWDIDPASGAMDCTAMHRALYGLQPDAPVSVHSIYARIHPDDRVDVTAAVQRAVADREAFEIEYRVIWPDGSIHWLAGRGKSSYGPDGRELRRLGVSWDVTQRKAAERLEHERNRLLELVATRQPLDDCLNAITASVPALHEGVDACVLIAAEAGQTIDRAVGGRFPPAFRAAIQGAPIGGAPFGTCGQAIHDGESRSCVDIAASSDWDPGWRALCLRHGIRGCHSIPVVGGAGRPVASFFLALGEPRALTDGERQVAAFGAHVASLAIERDRNDRARQQRIVDLTNLHDVSMRLTTLDERDQAMAEAIRAALTLTGSPKGVISIVDADRDELVLVASAGFDAPYLAQVARIGKGVGACGHSYLRGERVVVDDTETDPIFVPFRAAARDGDYRSAHAIPLRSTQQQVLGVLSLFGRAPGRPSERETQLADLLSRSVAAWLEQRRLLQALQASDRRKDEFLATLAHELRNPLAPIRNAVQLMALAGPKAPMESIRPMLERQVNHMVRLVDDLLEVSRISRGAIELRLSTIDLADVVDAAVETNRLKIEQSRHVLTWQRPGFTVPVRGDPVRLTQVVGNLLNNAVRYTDAGGHIEISVVREAGLAVVRVRDDGIGIAPEHLPLIFQMFAQVDRTRGRSQDGLGIGLSLVDRLVQMHGGTVQALSSGEGLGTTFTVKLQLEAPVGPPAPASASARALANGASSSASSSTSTPTSILAPDPSTDTTPDLTPAGAADAAAAPAVRRRVLVVDDNRDGADSTGTLIGLLGAEVRLAYDGAQALLVAEDWQPDLVLLDVGMPLMDGFEVAQRLRARSRPGALRIVALTGWGQALDRQRTQAAGFDEHLTKPVSIDVLNALLASTRAGTGRA